jgi:hypothetical protein
MAIFSYRGFALHVFSPSVQRSRFVDGMDYMVDALMRVC